MRWSVIAARVSVTPAAAAIAAMLGSPADAQDTVRDPVEAIDCDAASVFGAGLFTDICWDCVFPIRIAGSTMGGRAADAPARASEQPLCLCRDPLGAPHVGVTISLWEPARVVEIVRAPGCSPVMGGIKLPAAGLLRRGTGGEAVHTQGDKAFFHYHMWTFPILLMLDLFVVDRCVQDGYVDLDLMFMSELDPTWSFDELAFWTTPELALTSNLVAQSACVADSVAANAGEPLDPLFWCAGSWGGLYPLVGTSLAPDSMPEISSLLSARALAAAHRRGLSWRTMGADTLCRGVIDPFMPKTQYELSMWHPVAEANGRHAIGESTLLWGDWRNVPGEGDNVHLVWRWNDCCTAAW
jgi:conjugal transfer pilus assembly protein TraU